MHRRALPSRRSQDRAPGWGETSPRSLMGSRPRILSQVDVGVRAMRRQGGREFGRREPAQQTPVSGCSRPTATSSGHCSRWPNSTRMRSAGPSRGSRRTGPAGWPTSPSDWPSARGSAAGGHRRRGRAASAGEWSASYPAVTRGRCFCGVGGAGGTVQAGDPGGSRSRRLLGGVDGRFRPGRQSYVGAVLLHGRWRSRRRESSRPLDRTE